MRAGLLGRLAPLRRALGRLRPAGLGLAIGFVAATSGCANILGLRESVDDGDCVLNSDCAPDKACIFRVCSPPCQADKDCPVGQRCLRTDNGAACVNSSGAGCAQTCPPPTTCDTTQNVCRNGCTTNAECLGGQVCVDHVCRGSDTGHDPPILDAGNGLDSSVDSATGTGGTAGTSGAGGAAGSAGSGAAGGSAGATGSGGSGGSAGGGTGGTTGGAAGGGGNGGNAGATGTGGTVGSGGAVGTGGTAGGGGAAGGGTGGTVVTDASPTDGPADATTDRCAPECTVGDTRCGVNQGVETCVSVDGCLKWGAEVLCGGRKVCTGNAPTAACACAPRPTGCENGTGRFCADANTLVECAQDADQCIYKLTPTTCPVGKPCTGTHPNASCSCAAPPAACTGQGLFCESSTVVATCGLDGAGCLAITNRVTCPAGKPCTGAFGSAGCSCAAPPTECASGAGTYCGGTGAGEVITCGADGNGCLAITNMMACTVGKPCGGTPKSAACTCPAPPANCNQAGTNFCQSSTSIATCGLDSDGCLNVTGTSSCPAAKPCVNGVCTCPAPPAICNGMTGTFCSDANTLVTCANDVNGCLAMTATTPCGGGKQCTGSAGGASCTCLPPPTDCPTGTGQVCRAGNVLATCGPDPTTGCIVTTASGPCGAGTYCVGAYPSADCSGVCLAGAIQCATTTSTQTCTTAGQWGTPTSCSVTSPGCANGKCAYRAGSSQAGNSTNTLFSGYIYAIPFQVSVATTAYRLGMFGTGTGRNVRMAIYQGNSLAPLTRLGLTPSFASTSVAGAMEADLGTPLQLQTGTYYWIAAIGDADVPMYVTTNGAGYFLNTNPNGWNMLDSTFPAGGSMNYEMTPNFYVVLQDQ